MLSAVRALLELATEALRLWRDKNQTDNIRANLLLFNECDKEIRERNEELCTLRDAGCDADADRLLEQLQRVSTLRAYAAGRLSIPESWRKLYTGSKREMGEPVAYGEKGYADIGTGKHDKSDYGQGAD